MTVVLAQLLEFEWSLVSITWNETFNWIPCFRSSFRWSSLQPEQIRGSQIGFSGFWISLIWNSLFWIESMSGRCDAKDNHRDCGIKEPYWGPSHTAIYMKRILCQTFLLCHHVVYVMSRDYAQVNHWRLDNCGMEFWHQYISQHVITNSTNIKVLADKVGSQPERKLNKYKKVFIIVTTNW